MRACALSIIWLSASVASADAPIVAGGVRADGIAAIVGGEAPGPGVELVLRTDVSLRARITMTGRLGRPASSVPLPRELFISTLEQLIGEALIAREAERVRVTPPSDQDVAREQERLVEEAGGLPNLRELVRRLGATMAEVDLIARRRALVASFLQANLEGTAVVTDGEVDRAYAEGDHPFVDRPLEEVREPLRLWLARRAIDHAVARWVGVLRARTPVVLLVNAGASSGAPAPAPEPAAHEPSPPSASGPVPPPPLEAEP